MKNIFNVALPVLLIVFAVPLFAQAATGYMQCDGGYSSDANWNHSMGYSTGVGVIYNETVQANTSVPLTLQNLNWACSRINNPPDQCPRDLSTMFGLGELGVTAPLSMTPSYNNPTLSFYPPGSQYISTLISSTITYNSSVTQNFTAPSQPGVYSIDGLCSSYGDPVATYLTYTVTAPASFQCNDSLNNDNVEGADTLDPQCHTDCNVNNAGSYVATHNSETTPPNGTCPAAATLNLNGRAAFFQVVKNFFASITSKAFAGE